jgi:multidrug efflux pump subunit AcrB/ribosome modulation factor
MKAIISWFAHNPVAANLMMACILILGVLSLPDTRKELIPNVSLERIGITSRLPGAAVETIETSICRPIENRIYDIQGTIELTSMSYDGYCSVTVDVEEGYVTKEIIDDIKSRLDDPDLLPKEASAAEVIELSIRNRVTKLIISGPVGYSVLTSSAHQLRNRLLESNEISVIDLKNMKKPEITMSIPSFVLEQYSLSYTEIASMIQKQTGYLAGGVLSTLEGDVLITSDAFRDTTEKYQQIVVMSDPDGGEVLLGDIATIVDTRHFSKARASFDELPAVSIDVYRVGNQNITDISTRIRAELGYIDLPANVDVYIWQDEAKNFKNRVDLLVDNAFSGLLLLFTVLLLFLSARLSFWVSIGIPISFLGAFFLLPIFDVSINFISLFAFILVLGIVVDDAVVVGESIHHKNEQGLVGVDAALQGTFEVYKPIIFAVLTTIIAFLPLLNLPGPEGKLMRAIPIVVIATLIFSIIESLLILPAHLSNGKYNPKAKKTWLSRVHQRFSDFMDWLIKRFYTPLLTLCLRNKGVVVVLFTMIFSMFIMLMSQGWIKTVLFAAIEADTVVANVQFPEGTPRSKTEAAIRTLEQAADRVAEEYRGRGIEAVSHMYSVVGPKNIYLQSQSDDDIDHTAQVVLELAAPETRTFSGQELLARWRESTGEIQDVLGLSFSASMNAAKPDVYIEFSGYDLKEMYRLSDELAEHLKSYDGIFDIHTSHEEERTEAEIKLRNNASSLGLTLETVVGQINRAFHGNVVQRIQTKDEEVEVWLGLPENERSSSWYLENMHIEYAPDQYVPLSAVADVIYRPSKTHIKRYERKRINSVSAYVDPAVNSAEGINADLSENYLNGLVSNSPGISWDVGGYQRAVQFFLSILTEYYIMAILAMYLLMAILFSSYTQPLLVLYAIPFGLLGSVVGHVWLGLEMTLWSFVGMVAVSGVVVNDNLVLMDYINTKRAQGENLYVAIMAAGKIRFRPIMLTSLTTFAGLMPLISETSVQAQFLIPMAVSLGFGVVVATLISLLLVPATYMIMVETEEKVARLLSGKKGQVADTVEKAYEDGFEMGTRGSRAKCPYDDEVLSSSWEAGRSDARAQLN